MEMELGVVQERFADIVWANEPIGSGDLVKLCEKELNWKKPTTYTVLRKLCEKGLFQCSYCCLNGLTAVMEQYSCPSFKSSVRIRSQPSRSAAATICAS